MEWARTRPAAHF